MQVLMPILVIVPRYVFSILATAMYVTYIPSHPTLISLSVVETGINSVIPLSIVGAHSFYTTLSNFLGLIGYWASTYIAIVLLEHFLFRRPHTHPHPSSSATPSYNLLDWDAPRALPTGVPALVAAGCGMGVAIPAMRQVWWTGPIARGAGDVGFEMGFVVAGVVYAPLRAVEVWMRGHV